MSSYLHKEKMVSQYRLLADKGPAPLPLGNFADIVYLKKQSFLIQMRDDCTLYARASQCNGHLKVTIVTSCTYL